MLTTQEPNRFSPKEHRTTSSTYAPNINKHKKTALEKSKAVFLYNVNDEVRRDSLLHNDIFSDWIDQPLRESKWLIKPSGSTVAITALLITEYCG